MDQFKLSSVDRMDEPKLQIIEMFICKLRMRLRNPESVSGICPEL